MKQLNGSCFAKNWGWEVERWEKFLEGAAFAKTDYNDDKDDSGDNDDADYDDDDGDNDDDYDEDDGDNGDDGDDFGR